MDRWQTIIEPFRIHSVEPIRITSEAERQADEVKGGSRQTIGVRGGGIGRGA